jgi:hypothetical protein
MLRGKKSNTNNFVCLICWYWAFILAWTNYIVQNVYLGHKCKSPKGHSYNALSTMQNVVTPKVCQMKLTINFQFYLH